MTLRTVFMLTAASVWHRRKTLSLVVLTLTLSVSLLLDVQYLRTEVKQSFVNTISGTDLIVGARSGPLNLLLYSVFHIGNATNNISWDTYQTLQSNKMVDWMVPISLGDSHKGHRVIGTTADFFERFQYGQKEPLAFARGDAFDGVFEAVIGAEVADKLGYAVGDPIILSHGTGSVSFVQHQDKPFSVSGVLQRTGTPLDRAVLVSLEGIEAIHLGWEAGVPRPGRSVTKEQALQQDLTPETITAALVGVKSRMLVFRLQRAWNQYAEEPLTAILPGVALSQLWQLMGGFETALLAITGFVVIISLVGMIAVLLTTQAHRSREMAILRANGASPWVVAGLFSVESVMIAVVSVVAALVLTYGGLALLLPYLTDAFGLYLALRAPTALEWGILGLVPVAALLVSIIPAAAAYRRSLMAGLTPRE